MNAPQYPNPAETASTQSGLNRTTAITQQQLGMVDSTSPFGSQTFTQNGTWPDGTPRYGSSTTFNPQVQGIIDRDLTAAGQPIDLSNRGTEDRLMELGRNRLDPLLDRRRASTNQRLFNTGARPGSEAYRNAETALTQGENDAYNELLLSGHGQAFNEAVQTRNQPLNELNAIRSGTQIAPPQFSAAGVAPVDYTGQVGADYDARYRDYANMWSGIGNVAGAVGGWAFSSPELKTDVKKVGETPDDQNVYKFRYKGSPMLQLGLMADEVKKRDPGAVRKVGDYEQVNYPRALRRSGGLMALGAAA